MKILQVSMRDLIGQRFSGYQLHRSLKTLGHESNMLVLYKQSSDSSVQGHPKWVELLERGLYVTERISSMQGLLSPIALAFPFRHCFRRADVVHWHLIYPHYVSLPVMPLLTRLRPTVWTLHDPWATTGHCIHPLDCERWRTGCGKCPDLRRNFTMWFDTTALLWNIKRAAYRRSALTLVTHSHWMKGRAEASPLLSRFPCHMIPLGLDLNTWRLLDRDACRARLGIPSEARAIAFRMPRGQKQEHAKGIPWLIEALQRLEIRQPTYLLVFEEKGQLKQLAGKYNLLELGWRDDASSLVEAMTAADIFIMPSQAETAPTMALEAMACGTAVIASDSTALPEMIHAPHAGVVVPLWNGEALARAIDELLGDDTRRIAMGRTGRQIVESEHSYDRYVQRHLELYESLAKRSAGNR